MDDCVFTTLRQSLAKVPGIEGTIAHGTSEEGLWWIKIPIDIDHRSPGMWSRSLVAY